jgi:hypothetical protein
VLFECSVPVFECAGADFMFLPIVICSAYHIIYSKYWLRPIHPSGMVAVDMN